TNEGTCRGRREQDLIFSGETVAEIGCFPVARKVLVSVGA
ncbi:MAG: hypothetical protein ACI8VE_001928, partial [Natrialbaceae archaeon]